MRVDYNVPIKDGVVQDDTRIQESLPTLRHLLEAGASLVLLSHLGRPKGVDPKYSLAPVAEALGQYLSGVRFVPHSPGSDQAHQAVQAPASRRWRRVGRLSWMRVSSCTTPSLMGTL